MVEHFYEDEAIVKAHKIGHGKICLRRETKRSHVLFVFIFQNFNLNKNSAQKDKPFSADLCVIPRNPLVKVDFIVLIGRFGCQ